MLFENNIGLNIKESDYYLNVERYTYPRKVVSNSKSNYSQIFYLLSFDRLISITKKNTLSDQQTIDCFTFYKSITVGFCDDAQLTIINTKDKYLPLGDNKLMLIDGKNEEYKIKYTQTVNKFLFENYYIYIAYSENNYDWLSPIEELTSGFISNLTYQGKTIGSLAKREINRLPQRDPYYFSKVGIGVKKNIPIFKKLSFFYDFDWVYIKLSNYKIVAEIPEYNYKLETGVSYKVKNVTLSLSGLFYKNNLIGYNDLTFNQKTEHHFSSNFGSINFELKYYF